ncbi:OmpA family protein [Halomonas desiderata]|uniref:OmpA family protein n=1 Tax=Billgrantia desiderata TaxID=52021 RepID=A0ABS9AZH9_9GAMM|nr:OmpA family protein [Halomonas desiderata]MCE8040596.1 OmpA family protein [Halomonas desiderata]MCE8045171.1 OmpA family protein [Halomonas desiderata]NIC37129.1 OmpA family protein [Halomonas desiderata]
MLDRSTRNVLHPPPTGEGDEESWLVSYLDVLTLLITLFVLLLSLAGNGLAVQGSRHGGEVATAITPQAEAAARMVAGAGLKPQHEGLQPRLPSLNIEGVSVAEGQRGITLRIDDNLLFSSGQATLTAQGREVLSGLRETLERFDGDISVEGHTDDIPIATAQFPSNWELSSARAIAVLRYLSELGVPTQRLRAVGYADTRPMESNDSIQGRAANRRVELLLHQELRDS